MKSSSKTEPRILTPRRIHLLGHLGWVCALAAVGAFIVPRIPVAWGDGWGFVSLRNLARMVTGLAFIQALGGLLGAALGARAGVVSTGILGGFISSTAVTATAARHSQKAGGDVSTSALLFASSTLAMNAEGIAVVAIGFPAASLEVYSVFLGPLLVNLLFAIRGAKKVRAGFHSAGPPTPDFLAIGRLSLFLIAIIAASRLIRHLFGKSGLFAFTLLASFFEIHATLISNTALRKSDGIEEATFILLIAISLFASALSKLLIVRSIGSAEMFRIVRKWTLMLLLALLVSTSLALAVSALATRAG